MFVMYYRIHLDLAAQCLLDFQQSRLIKEEITNG